MTSLLVFGTARNDTSKAAFNELRFKSLFREGRGCSFPCDERGGVDLNTRTNYLFARAMVGRELATPEVRAVGG